MSSRRRVFGVLVTYRRQHLLPDTLERILLQTRPPDRLIVVDNEDSPETARLVAECAADCNYDALTYIASPENNGPAGGMEIGMSRALQEADDADWILTLDDDDPPLTVTDIERISEFADQQRNGAAKLAGVGIVGAQFNWKTGMLVRLPDHQIEGAVRVDYLGSNHLALYCAGVMRDVGVFRGELFWREEVDYGLRVRRAGYQLVACGPMWKERRTASSRCNLRLSPSRTCEISWRKYYITRNHVEMMCRFHRYDLALACVLIQCVAKPAYTALRSPVQAGRGCRWAWRAAADGFLRRMGRRVDPVSFAT